MKKDDWFNKRPGKITSDIVEKLGRLRCTQREAAAFFGVRHHEFTAALSKSEIRQAWDRGQEMGLLSLRRKQIRLASSSAPMAIFLGKNMLGQRDVTTLENPDETPLDFSRISQKQRDQLRSILDAVETKNAGGS